MSISARALCVVRSGRKRKFKVSVAKVHERLATNLTHSDVHPVTVDDPYQAGEKIVVMTSLRDDPLGRYHARGRVDDAQYSAGRAWQRDYEDAEIGGVGAIDTTKEPVDGRRFPETVTDRMRQAMARIAADDRLLGMIDGALVRDVLGKRMFFEQVAAARGFGNQRSVDYFSRRFREALEILAVGRGFAMRSQKPTRG